MFTSKAVYETYCVCGIFSDVFAKIRDSKHLICYVSVVLS